MAFNNRDELSDIRAKIGRAIDRVVDVRDFGVTGDGSDETTKMQAAIDAAGSTPILIPLTRVVTKTLYAHRAVIFIGWNCAETVLEFQTDTNHDGIVLGWRNYASPYPNVAAFNAEVSGLEDGWYLVGSTDLRFVQGGVQAKTATRITTPIPKSNLGYGLQNIRLEGASENSVRDLLVCNLLWKLDLSNVWTRNCAGRGFVFNQCLHVSAFGLKSDQTGSHSVECTGGVNTTIQLFQPYLRRTVNGSAVKTNTLGLTMYSPIIEGIGRGGSPDVYAPSIWVTGGSCEIFSPYFEDTCGHNVLCNSGETLIHGGRNWYGGGDNTEMYASIFVQGDARVHIAGSGYAPGGGNRLGVKISKECTGGVFGAIYNEPIVVAKDLADETAYTGADYDVANETAVLAISSPSSGETAHAQDTGREYAHDGTKWNIVRNYDFRGHIVARDVSGQFTQAHGRDVTLRSGDSPSQMIYSRARSFHAGAGYDNIAALKSGASIPSQGSASSGALDLGFQIGAYSAATAHLFSVRFSTPRLFGGCISRANIISSTQFEIVVSNLTSSSLTLPEDVRGQIVIEKWQEAVD